MSGALAVPKDAGVIATLVRGTEVVTIHRAGTPTFALRAVVRACDRYGWKIRTLSSPVTIYRDLDGSRSQTNRAARKGQSLFYTDPPENETQMPEKTMLGYVGRLDLLA